MGWLIFGLCGVLVLIVLKPSSPNRKDEEPVEKGVEQQPERKKNHLTEKEIKQLAMIYLKLDEINVDNNKNEKINKRTTSKEYRSNDILSFDKFCSR